MAARRALTLLLAALLALLAPGCAAPDDGYEDVTIAGRTFRLRRAADDASRERGLGGVAELAPDEGMLFVFTDAQVRSFWMKDCTIDIDVAFLDNGGRVVAVQTMRAIAPRGPDESEAAYEARLRPTAAWSNWPARFAIELRAGAFAELGVEVDDLIELDLERLRGLARTDEGS